jgi:hypothetical protein
MCLDKQFNRQQKNLRENHLLYWFVKVNGMVNGGIKCTSNDKWTGRCKYENGCIEGSVGNWKPNAVKKTLINQLQHSKKYEGYPESKFRLRILPLQRCGHDGALACRVV